MKSLEFSDIFENLLKALWGRNVTVFSCLYDRLNILLDFILKFFDLYHFLWILLKHIVLKTLL